MDEDAATDDDADSIGEGPVAGLRLVWHGRGVAAVPTLAALLSPARLLSPAQARREGADAVLAWGRKPSAARAETWARRQGLPVWRIEDGLLRSIEPGPRSPPLSLVWDDEGIYYDASQASRLERLVRRPLTAARLARAQALRQAWCDGRLSKYNHAREPAFELRDDDVLVVDQTAGDASIAFGAASPASFARMLDAALDEHPRARILLKQHPEVVAGRKRGHFDPQALSVGTRGRIVWLGSDVHPPGLLARVAAVYGVSSQLGFEALLWGRPVRCFGLPFYAGWGLTGDDLPAPARRTPVPLEALVHAALVDYGRCVDPETGQRCPPEHLVSWMALQRRQRERFPAELVALDFSWWKRPIARRFLAGSEVRFQSSRRPVPEGATLVLWGARPPPPEARPSGVIRLEDGFIRSVGLGADLRQPLSWVQDGRGLYYDAQSPSALEQGLNTVDPPPDLLARAARLRERIVSGGLSKYNLAGESWTRPAGRPEVLLVIGQVEGDASIRHGAPGLNSNLDLLKAVRQAHPAAWLLYKPHPDVVADLRASGRGEAEAAQVCDEVVPRARIEDLLPQVDGVHVLTSLAGFEALLRGTPVTTWGLPFYAGWGLTRDQLPTPRRSRRLSLDGLVAGALIVYPAYVSRVTGAFTTPERALDELQAWREDPGRSGRGAALLQGARRLGLRLLRRWRGV